jgi:hypothetical protein
MFGQDHIATVHLPAVIDYPIASAKYLLLPISMAWDDVLAQMLKLNEKAWLTAMESMKIANCR